MTDPPGVVTEHDIRVVAEHAFRSDLRALHTLGRITEVVGWVAAALSVAVLILQAQRVADRGDGAFGTPWGDIVAFALPSFLGALTAAALLVLAGRAARLLAGHLGLQRGVNLTGLTLGEPLDLGAMGLEED